MAHPRVVSGWLDKTALTGAERIWFVMDCGSEIGNAAGYNRRLRRKSSCGIWAQPRLSCRKTTLPCSMRPKRAGKEHCGADRACTSEGADPAQSRAGVSSAERDPLRPLYERPGEPGILSLLCKADAFRATDACIGCGKCVELCPLNNIHLESGRPVWGKNCTHCMACICYCPNWKRSRTPEGERKLDEVFILAWVEIE